MVLAKIFLASFLVNNIVFVQTLGVCPLFCLSAKTLFSWGLSLTINLIAATAVNWLVYHYLLLPLQLLFLRTLVFLLVVVLLATLTPLLLKTVRSASIIFTVNCAVLGVPLLAINYQYSFVAALIFALGSGLGFLLVAIIFVAIRERLARSPVPASFQGYPIQLITIGLLALVFFGFTKFLGL